MDQVISNRRYILLAAMLASFLTPFMGSSINLAIPALARDFQCAATTLNWIVTANLLASAAFAVPFGRIADLYGRKKIFTAGILIFMVSSFLCGLAASIEFLFVFRIVQGIGGAMIFGTGVAMLTAAYPLNERGRVLGLNTASIYVGLSLGPILGGFLTQHLGWPAIFFLTAFLGLLAVLTVTRGKEEPPRARGEKFDAFGTLLFSTSLAAIIYGTSAVQTSPAGRWMLVGGLVLLFFFVLKSFKSPSPLLDLRLFSKNIAFAFSNLAALINHTSAFSTGFLLSIYLQIVKGLDPSLAGLVLLSQPVLQAILSPFAGRLSDRVEPRIVSSLGMALITGGLLTSSTFHRDTPFWLVTGILMLMGVGFALFASPNTNAVMSSVEKRFYGVASSTLATMRLVGQAFSMSLVTLFFALNMRGLMITPESASLFLKSMKISFFVFAILCFAGIFASLARGSVREKMPVREGSQT